MPIDASKIIWDNLEDIDVSKVVWDKTEDVSAGILTHEPKTTTELQPPITRHGLPEEAGEPISTITGKPVKPAKETLPKYQTPGYTGTWDKEYDVIGGIKDVGKLLYDVPVNTIGAVASLWEDDNPEAEYDWKDIAIKNQELRSEQRAIEEGGEKYVLPGVQRKDIREASKSAGFSAVAMGGGLLGGLAATPVPVPGARIAGALAGSGVAAYSMDKTMFTSQLIDSYRQTIQREEGRDVTPDEVAGFVEKTRGLRSKHALWEAIPESIGNVAQLSGIGGMFKAALGKKLGTKIFSTLIGMYGAEIGTETITQMGQHNVEVEAGLSPGQKRSFKSVDDYYESFKEVAPQTFVLVSLTGGAGAVGTKSYQLIANPKNTNDASEVNPVVMQFNKGEIDLPQAVDQINASDASQEAKKAATDLLKKPEPGKEKLLAKFQEAKDKRLEPRILAEDVYGSKRGLPFTNKNLANLNKNRIAKEVGVTPEDLTMIPVEDGFAWKKIVEPVELKEGRALTTKEITAERARVFEEAPRKPAEVSAEVFEREVTEEEKVRARAEIEPDINKFLRRAKEEEVETIPIDDEQARLLKGLPKSDVPEIVSNWNKIWTTGTEAAKDARMVEAQTLIKARPDLFTLVRDIKGDVELMAPEEAEKLPAGQGFVIKPVTKLRKAPVAKPLEAEVEYKPIVTKSGKPFKTMALANASLKQRGLSQTDHTIIEHEGGYAIQRFGRKIKAVEPTPVAKTTKVARDVAGVEKQPWEMTKAEYVKPPYTSPAMHKYGVTKALKEGKAVPESVLAEYPDLKPVEAEKPAKPEAVTKEVKAEAIPEVKLKIEKQIEPEPVKPEVVQKPEPGQVWIKDKRKPIIAARRIKRGKDEGKYQVTLTRGRDAEGNIKPGLKRIVPKDAIIKMPVEAEKAPVEKVEVETTPEGKEITVDLTKKEESALTPKKQKEYLMAEIDTAIEEAPTVEPFENLVEKFKKESKHLNPTAIQELREKYAKIGAERKEEYGTITINVPDDGVFTILNTKQSLEDFKKKAKQFPAALLRAKVEKPSVIRKTPLKESIDELVKISGGKDYFTDGGLVIKGKPPARSKYGTRTTTQKALESLLSSKTEAVELKYYAFQEEFEGEGVSATPIPNILITSGDKAMAVFQTKDGSLYNYDQFKLNSITKRFPKVEYGIAEGGLLVAYENKTPVAGLMPIQFEGAMMEDMAAKQGFIEAKKPPKEATKKPTGVEANKEAYGSQEKADAAVESVAKEAQSVSTKSVPDRVRVAESDVIKELKSKKRVDFTGRKLTSGNESQEIAELFQVYRSPKLEILHTIYTTEDGTILGHNAMTSGQIDYVAPGDMTKYTYSMKSAAKRLGATKVHVLHNHPSGNEEMSPQDVNFAAKISKDLGVKGGEFVVIDHGKFSRVAKLEAGVGSVEYGKFKTTEGIKDWTTGKVKISSEQEMAQFGRSLAYDKNKAIFIYLGNQNEVQGWTIHDKKILAKGNIALRNSIQQQIKAHDATKAVLIADSPLLLKRIVKGQRIGNWLIDVQDVEGNSLRVEFPGSFEVGGEAPKQAWGLFEPKTEYGKSKAKLTPAEKTELSDIKALKRKLRSAELKLEKIKTSKDILQNRRYKIRAFRDYFNLTDKELREISRKDIRLMSNYEFKQFVDQMEIKAERLNVKRQAMNELVTQIMDKELNVENLRKAMKLPTLKNMTVEQIKKLDEALSPFQKGDEFLSVRKLETVDRTELEGIKTWREARERLSKKLGVPVDKLQSIKVSEFDRFRYDTGLAEKNPFYRMMVEETAKRMLVSEAEYLKIEQDVFDLAKKTKGRKFLIPQYKKIRKFMEVSADEKAKINLTSEELALVDYMTSHFSDAMDYLLQIEAMKMGKENYFTHVRRGILEAIKEDGIIKAVKEQFEAYKLDEQAFNILDRETGEVLAMDKFFKFAMKRTGKLKPTENIVKAFLTYMRTFKKKQVLDEITPLIDIYAHALTPKGMTKKGLLLHGNLIKFVKEWINTQKGRHITLIAKQNGKIDAALRAIKMFTSLRDLAFNIPVSIATEVGEQITTYQLLGKGKFVLGKLRQNTKQGKAIVEKYRNLIGKNPWKELVEPSKEIGDRLMEGIFVLFRDASTRSNKTFLLGSLSKAEFKSGEITPGRLAALRTELGRYRMVEGMKSIIGATPEGKSYTQYKRWAIPILRTTIKNLGNVGKKITFQKPKSKEFKKSALEIYRLVEVTAFVMLMFGMVRDEDDKSFAGKIINKAYREATTLIQALQPSMFLTAGRTASFVKKLGVNLTLILQREKYKTTDEYKGIKKLKRQFTPVAISQFAGEKEVKLKRKPKLSERFSKRRLDRKKKLSDRWKRR